jgi:hypothetical protein
MCGASKLPSHRCCKCPGSSLPLAMPASTDLEYACTTRYWNVTILTLVRTEKNVHVVSMLDIMRRRNSLTDLDITEPSIFTFREELRTSFPLLRTDLFLLEPPGQGWQNNYLYANYICHISSIKNNEYVIWLFWAYSREAVFASSRHNSRA